MSDTILNSLESSSLQRSVNQISSTDPFEYSLGESSYPVSVEQVRVAPESAVKTDGDQVVSVRLPSAGDYASGQYFTIKDEGGNADTYSITILPSGSQTIDGAGSISLLSPYSAVNLYSNGVDKFFIY